MTRAALAVALAAGCATSPTTPPAAAPSAATTSATALHLLGELPSLADAGAPGSIVEARYDVCLDDAGRVARVSPAPGLAAADGAIVKALARWSWFVVAPAPRPCFRQSVLVGVPAVGRIVRQAGAELRAHALVRPATTPPPMLTALHAGTIVDGVYKVCVADDGRVTSVRPVAGIAGGDNWSGASLRATAWEVVVGPLAQAPYCFAATVHVDASGVARRAGAPSLPPPEARPTEPGVSIVVTR